MQLQMGGLIPGLDNRSFKVLAITSGIAAVTGEQPIVKEYETYTEIDFTDNQKIKLQNQLAKWHDAEPGEIRVNVQPVIGPFYLKKYGLMAAGGLVGALLLGKLL